MAPELAASRLSCAARSMRKLMIAAYDVNSLWLLHLHSQSNQVAPVEISKAAYVVKGSLLVLLRNADLCSAAFRRVIRR